jgi:hypothetical protein
MTTLTPDLPKVGIVQSLDSGKLELENMSLTWVHVHCVDLLAPRGKSVVQNIITCTGDSENPIGRLDIEALNIDGGIFPCPAIDMGPELLVYLLFQIGYSPSLVISWNLSRHGRSGPCGVDNETERAARLLRTESENSRV